MKKLFEAKREADKRYILALRDWAEQLSGLVREKGGITYSFEEECFPGEGFAVGTEGHEAILPLKAFGAWAISAYIQDHLPQLFEEGYCLGIWIDGDSVYLDLSLVFEDQVEASLVARAHKQLAYYDLAKKEEVRI